jgi:hypothetical protein
LFSEFKKDDIEEFSSSEEDIENKFKNFFKKKRFVPNHIYRNIKNEEYESKRLNNVDTSSVESIFTSCINNENNEKKRKKYLKNESDDDNEILKILKKSKY